MSWNYFASRSHLVIVQIFDHLDIVPDIDILESFVKCLFRSFPVIEV